MVAEDKVINLEIIKQYLDKLGVTEQSTICVNGQEALDKCISLIDTAL